VRDVCAKTSGVVQAGEDSQSRSYKLDTWEEMKTQSDHNQDEWSVPRTFRHNKAIDVDKAQ